MVSQAQLKDQFSWQGDRTGPKWRWILILSTSHLSGELALLIVCINLHLPRDDCASNCPLSCTIKTLLYISPPFFCCCGLFVRSGETLETFTMCNYLEISMFVWMGDTCHQGHVYKKRNLISSLNDVCDKRINAFGNWRVSALRFTRRWKRQRLREREERRERGEELSDDSDEEFGEGFKMPGFLWKKLFKWVHSTMLRPGNRRSGHVWFTVWMTKPYLITNLCLEMVMINSYYLIKSPNLKSVLPKVICQWL